LENVDSLHCEFTVSGSALYGKPYIEAAKDTWRLFKDRGMPLPLLSFQVLAMSHLGIDALVNDSHFCS